MKLEQLQKVQTGFLNTPIHELKSISQKYKTKILIKRDDLTGFALGGNKLRKLDYLVKDAINNNCSVLLTYGGPQTNHGRLTAAAAVRFGLKCGIIMDGIPPEKASGNIVLDKMMGADLFFMDDSNFKSCPRDVYRQKYADLKQKTTAEVIKMYEEKGEKVYPIPVGGSSEIGAAGYIMAVKEILNQLKEKNEKVDYVVTGFGSTGTFGGLYLGAKYYDAPFEIVGISVSEKTDEDLQEKVDYINKVSKYFDLGIDVKYEDIWVEGGFVGNGYNIPDEETRKYIYEMAREEAIILDPCYTGKTYRGLIELIKNKKIKEGSTVLFLHTGGVPGIYSNEHLEAMQNEIWNGEKKVFKL